MGVPADKLALGYRWEHETWSLEPMLHDGEGGACGGLITTLDDFAKYGYGLQWKIDSGQVITLSHTGGLLGFGSHYRFLPDYGVAVMAFANRTYAPAGIPLNATVPEHGSRRNHCRASSLEAECSSWTRCIWRAIGASRPS